MASALTNLGLTSSGGGTVIDGTEDVPGLDPRLESIENSIASIQIPAIPVSSGLTQDDVDAAIALALSALSDPLTTGGSVFDVSVASGNASVSSANFTANDVLNITGATVNGRTVTLPAVQKTISIVSARSNTKTVTIVVGSTSYKLSKGGFIIVYLDGTANYMKVLANGNTTFTGLTDMPPEYGSAGDVLVVNSAGDGGEWRQPGLTVATISATTHAPAVADANKTFRCTHASGCAVTIPLNSTQAFPIGTTLEYIQEDADSAVSVAATGGVTLLKAASFNAASAEQYALVGVSKIDTNTWLLYGHLDPV